MSDLIATDTQRLEQDAVVELFTLDVRRFGEGFLRFCQGPVDGANPRFNGYEYAVVPITADGFKWDGQGTLPSPTLQLSTMNQSLSALIRQADDLVGCPVTRTRTFRRYLDDGDSPDPEAIFPVDSYLIERKVRHNAVMVELELSVSFDQRGKMIPGRQIIRDTCTHSYRKWDGSEFDYSGVSCPYSGYKCFTSSGAPTSLREEDKCGKRLSDCEARYGKQPLPFYGFPGAGRL